MKIAIYSRKSKFTGKGESIENQIEMCRDYAEKHCGPSDLEYTIYEDEGFSGGNVDRPRFQQMLQDAKSKKFDVLICYRLDRVSRNIADFSSLIEELQSHGISFVSIREQFDTSTPLGRAMMFIASVFAQLERETIAERVRDNMLELAKTGRWLGGPAPFGFESERVNYLDEEYKERSLVKLNPIADEMQQIEFIYDKYLELGSIHQVQKFLIQNNITTKTGTFYSKHVISDILRNPVYAKADNAVFKYLQGKGIAMAGQDRINSKRAILLYNKVDKKSGKNDFNEWIGAVAKHEGYISSEKWLKVQYQMDKNSMKLPRSGTSEIALLSGLIRCAKCGAPMNVTYGPKKKDGTVKHYYTCNLKFISKEKCQNTNANGANTDNAVVGKLIKLSESKDALLAELHALKSEKKLPDKANVLDELKSKKERLIAEINNLVGEVSKSAAASKYILPQIEARDQEVKKLDEEITKLEKEKEEKEKETEGFELVVNNILNFAGIIDNLSNREKKTYLRTIIDKVFWDGDSEELAIKLLNNIDVSQFRSGSSRSGNKNHTATGLL